MTKVYSNLKKAQKIGIGIIVITLITTLTFYNDEYGFVYGGLLGAGIGLLFWSKDTKENKK
tara:strand:+ start:186 stop:368 length:183 start_codon:yes stop_codon:yes gene_type:complete